MNPLALLLAAGIPAIFLLIIYTQDLYASRTFRLVLLCFAWGALGGVGLSFLFNTYVAYPTIRKLGWDMLLLYVVFAPIVLTHPLMEFDLPSDWDYWERFDREHLARCTELAVLMLEG